MTDSLKTRIQEDMKSAMRSKDVKRLGCIRLILAAVKQREVDERITLDDVQIISIMGKMVKQRHDSITAFEKGGRQDLVDIETAEITVIQEYLPAALAEDEITTMIEEAIQSCGAASMKDMGKVMGQLKAKIQGRADMGAVSSIIKQKLS